ncbi:MAG: prohibitin family protein [Deltaproteobacteria bacterium]|nr:prohibitin family protein [Deltaproteobacteria bacterium]
MLFVFSLVLAVLLLAGAALAGRLAARSTHRTFDRSYRVGRSVLGVGGAAFLLVALVQCLTVIPAGHVGVVDFFGRVSPGALAAGIQIRNPLATIVKMSVQTQEIKETMDVPSKEGLTVGLEASVLFHLDPDQAPEVYRSVGTNYVEVLLEPQFRSVTRGVTAGYEAKALYTSERGHLAQLLTDELSKVVSPRGVIVENTPLRQLKLPVNLSESIEQKLQAEQESQRMEFVLQREQQEAERKRIEAQGIADFQRTVSEGISDQLLRWKGIEATLEIATSQNAKVIIAGGQDGLPIILDTH